MSPLVAVRPLITIQPTHSTVTGAATQRAKALIPVKPNTLLVMPTTAMMTPIVVTAPHP
jgi:hypothetical protein